MPYNVDFKIHQDYLEANIKGERNETTAGQDTLKTIGIVAQKCRELELSRILFIWELKGKIDKSQAIILISNLERYKWSREFKAASVHPNLENFKSNSFTQTVINNLGWNTKIFQEKETAMKWLFN